MNSVVFLYAIRKLNVQVFVHAKQIWKLQSGERTVQKHVYDMTMVFSLPSLCKQAGFDVHMEKNDALDAFGKSWANSPNGTVEYFDWERVLHKMGNATGQRSRFVYFLTHFAFFLYNLEGERDASPRPPRRKQMAVRRPMRSCSHDFGYDSSLVRCSCCGFLRRRGVVSYVRASSRQTATR